MNYNSFCPIIYIYIDDIKINIKNLNRVLEK